MDPQSNQYMNRESIQIQSSENISYDMLIISQEVIEQELVLEDNDVKETNQHNFEERMMFLKTSRKHDSNSTETTIKYKNLNITIKFSIYNEYYILFFKSSDNIFLEKKIFDPQTYTNFKMLSDIYVISQYVPNVLDIPKKLISQDVIQLLESLNGDIKKKYQINQLITIPKTINDEIGELEYPFYIKKNGDNYKLLLQIEVINEDATNDLVSLLEISIPIQYITPQLFEKILNKVISNIKYKINRNKIL